MRRRSHGDVTFILGALAALAGCTSPSVAAPPSGGGARRSANSLGIDATVIEPPVSAPTASHAASAEPAGTCSLNLNSRPPSTVLLDGRPLGRTPLIKVTASAGAHTLFFADSDGGGLTSFQCAPGETKTVAVNLRDGTLGAPERADGGGGPIF